MGRGEKFCKRNLKKSFIVCLLFWFLFVLFFVVVVVVFLLLLFFYGKRYASFIRGRRGVGEEYMNFKVSSIRISDHPP